MAGICSRSGCSVRSSRFLTLRPQIGERGDLKKRIELGEGGDELHQLADRFNEMFARLDEAFEKERQFTADASHEMRTPMSVIMAQCELALEGRGDEADYVKALQVIQRQGKKMTRLINDMLDFTRLEQRADQYPRESVDLSLRLCVPSARTCRWYGSAA